MSIGVAMSNYSWPILEVVSLRLTEGMDCIANMFLGTAGNL